MWVVFVDMCFLPNLISFLSPPALDDSNERSKGTGRVSGKVVTDVVSIAGLTIAGQAFGIANNESVEFSKQPNDGLIGMAFGTIAQSRQPTFFENLIKEHKIAAPLFSVHLSRHEERGSSVCILICVQLYRIVDLVLFQ
jgi:hypothetical protein